MRLRILRRMGVLLAMTSFGVAAAATEEHPWPSFRHDLRNTGRSTRPVSPSSGRPWAFQTGKGIFSTPVIDRDGVVYVGSADRNLYAVGPEGTERWRHATGEIIDSAGALGPPDSETGRSTLTFGSGDGFVHQLRTGDGLTPEERLVWRFDARSAPGPGFNHWFEGNVVRLPDGSFLAGNTNFRYYALRPDGTLAWHFTTGSNAWSAAAVAEDGTIHWGSLDGRVRAVHPGGDLAWQAPTLGFVASSVALGRDGTAYVGSFDGGLYAYAPGGSPLPAPLPPWRLHTWRFGTRDHVYGSPALLEDASGKTLAIFVGSADGGLYAVSPEGALLWRYEAGDAIRSSPVVGPAPEGGEIVYFGAGDGRLHAVNAATGARRFVFDTTPDDPELRDRNDLNASPALGPHGIAIGGEHGLLWHVPYDWCLRAEDPRCVRGDATTPPSEAVRLRWVTPGGSVLDAPPDPVPAATTLTFRLDVLRDGRSVDAAICGTGWRCGDGALAVSLSPPIPHRVELSADGRHLHVLPEAPLPPGEPITLRIRGDALEDRWRIGTLAFGGSRGVRFDETLQLRVAPASGSGPPLSVSPDAADAVEWKRLAVPLPTMMPSLNQIGFDSYDWILSALATTAPDAQGRGRLLLFANGAQRDAAGDPVVDPRSDFAFALGGSYQGEAFTVAARDLPLEVTDIPIPFSRFELRGSLGRDGRVQPGASVFAETRCLGVPNYGALLALGGLCNDTFGKLVTSGTFLTRPMPEGSAVTRRPEGISVRGLSFQAGVGGTSRLEAVLDGAPPSGLSEHRVAFVLADPDTLEPLALGEGAGAQLEAGSYGDSSTLSLEIPPTVALPEEAEVFVVWDGFPLHRERLALR